MNKNNSYYRQVVIFLLLNLTLGLQMVLAGKPLCLFTPLTPTTITVPAGMTANVSYLVTNQSKTTHTFKMTPIDGVTQVTSAANCQTYFTLKYQESCILSLSISGDDLDEAITEGPDVCDRGNPLMCYRPSYPDNLRITPGPTVYTVGGTVSGLIGTVILENNGESLTITENGGFTFSQTQESGGTYNVIIKTQPQNQTCTVTNGAGTIGQSDVNNVAVQCVNNTYSVGGTVSGLTGTLILQNNAETLTVNANGSFVFSQKEETGQTYDVLIQTQPANQLCTVSNGVGTIGQADVTNVVVQCTNTYTVGGNVYGLSGTLTLADNTGENIIMESDGSFVFSTAFLPGSQYQVRVISEPIDQTCTVNDGAGVITNQNISDITVNCSDEAYTVGGNVTGLSGTVVLLNNDGDPLPITANGSFTFPVPVANGADYEVTVQTNPATQTCTVNNGEGTIDGNNVSNVGVICSTTAYTIGGTVNGLNGTVVLQNNGGDDLSLSANGTFTFSKPVASGAIYTVEVEKNPATQNCVVTNGTGTATGNVTNVQVDCTIQNTQLSTSASELALSVSQLTEYGVPGTPSSGVPRIITITNTGTAPAENLTINFPTWPSGTTASTTCLSTLPGNNQSCTITITPGTIASTSVSEPCNAGSNANAPDPEKNTITVTSSNANSLSMVVYVLGYSCVYKGGYIFAFDDRPAASTSVAGKVVSRTAINRNYWSTQNEYVFGIDSSSTPSNPSPTINEQNGQLPCLGRANGACNSNNISVLSAISGVTYAAALCKQTIDNFTDWYLPSLCELVYSTVAPNNLCGSGINSPITQNIATMLSGKDINYEAPPYWSSTESSANPLNNAWRVFVFTSGSPSADNIPKNATTYRVLCARGF